MNTDTQVRLHLTRYEMKANDFGMLVPEVEDKFIPMNWVEGVGVRHILGKKGYRVIVKHAGKVYELHRNKNTDFFKAMDRKQHAGFRSDLWASKESDRWLSDAAWIAFSKINHRQ